MYNLIFVCVGHLKQDISIILKKWKTKSCWRSWFSLRVDHFNTNLKIMEKVKVWLKDSVNFHHYSFFSIIIGDNSVGYRLKKFAEEVRLRLTYRNFPGRNIPFIASWTKILKYPQCLFFKKMHFEIFFNLVRIPLFTAYDRSSGRRNAAYIHGKFIMETISNE